MKTSCNPVIFAHLIFEASLKEQFKINNLSIQWIKVKVSYKKINAFSVKDRKIG